MLISCQHQLPPCKRANQNQQTRLRQMKIRQHRIGSLELKPRPNEQIRLARPAQEHAFDSANAGCTRANHPPRSSNPRRIFVSHMKSLRMQRFASNRLKRPQPDMKRHMGNFNAPPPACIQNLPGEVQPSGRSRHRPRFMRKHRLIPFPIHRSIRPLDIRRQWDMADPLKPRIDVAV